jgi:hypothetical protein
LHERTAETVGGAPVESADLRAPAPTPPLANVALDIAGDSVTLLEATAAVGELVGRTLIYRQIPIAALRQNGEDLARMLERFESTGYSADVAGQESFGIRALTLADWVPVHRKRS